MRCRLHFVTVVLGLTLLQAAAAADVRPNVVIIMTDDQGFGDLGVQGHPILETPRIDALAAESATLEAFYVHPVCTPTRAALLTGRHPQRTTAFDTWIGRAMLGPEEITIAERLGAAGYATGIFGKWHLGDCPPMRPGDQGFDRSVVHRGGGIAQPADPEGGEGRYTDPILLRDGVLESFEGWCTDIYVDEMIDWMDDQSGPFLAVLTTNAPHGPFHDVPPAELADYQSRDLDRTGASNLDRMARILAMDANLDRNVGRVLDAIDVAGVRDDTIIVYLHDNGADHDGFSAGLRGRKGTVFEGGVRSPFFIRWPGRFEPGTRQGVIGMHLDVVPTVLEACGLGIPDVGLDGRSLFGALERDSDGAGPDPDRTVVVQAHRGDAPVRWSNVMVRSGDWKLVNASGFGRELEPGVAPPLDLELFDLRSDPGEQVDLADRRPDIVTRLSDHYEAWFGDVSRGDADAYLPPSIRLGATPEPVWLTRQDWRRTRRGGWGGRSSGVWWVEADDAGPYRIRVRSLPDQPRPKAIRVEFDGRPLTRFPIESETGSMISGPVGIPARRGRLCVVVEDEAGEYGAYQVEIRHERRSAPETPPPSVGHQPAGD